MSPSVSFQAKLHYQGKLSDLMSVFSMGPLHIIEFDTDEAGIILLQQHYGDRLCRTFRNANGKQLTSSLLIFRLAENEFIFARGDGCNDIEILAPSEARANALLAELRSLLGTISKVEIPGFGMLSLTSDGLSCERAENMPAPSEEAFLHAAYGSDINEWIDAFAAKTIARNGGFTLMDGPPGTGKTSLITQMMLRHSKTHVFYVLPVAQANAFAAPDFLPFWQQENSRHPDRVKVVVVEDADRLLRRRKEESSPILPALLNVADGLTGRMLRLHVICSINCHLDELDPAILRPGRLINHRRFDLLDTTAALTVAKHAQQPWQPRPGCDRYSLAEILNPIVLEEPKPKRLLGFAA